MILGILSLTLLSALTLGLIVFSVAPGHQVNRLFGAFMWVTALWVLNDLAFWGFADPNEDGADWVRTGFLIGLAMQLAYLWFAWSYPEPRRFPWLYAGILLAPLIPIVPLILAGKATGAVGFVEGQFQLEFTPVTFFAGGYLYILFLTARILLARREAEARDELARVQSRSLLIAAWVSGGLASVAIAIGPLFGEFRLLPFASVGILIGTIFHAHGMLSNRLLRPKSIFDEFRMFPVTGKLALSISATSLATVGTVVLASRIAVGPGITTGAWAKAVVFSLCAASLPAMVLIAIAHKIVSGPLRQITEASLAVAEGRLGVRVQVGRKDDEVALLARSFNEMVARLEADFEALRELSEGMLRAERLTTAGTLAAGVAHEVNNPLAAVSALVQLARDRSDDERSRALLEDAVSEMERVARALQDLMAIARPSRAQLNDAALSTVVADTTRLLSYDKRFRDVSVQLELPEDLPRAAADPDRLRQVLLNLLLNARDAMEMSPRKCIVISAEAGDGRIILRLRDHGPGLSEELRAQVFKPFFSTKLPGAGTGLGLAVCRDILRRGGGSIELRNAEGGGAVAEITLPEAGAALPLAPRPTFHATEPPEAESGTLPAANSGGEAEAHSNVQSTKSPSLEAGQSCLGTLLKRSLGAIETKHLTPAQGGEGEGADDA